METRKKRCLPEALDASGRWTAERRSEVLALFQNHVYGTLPQTGFSVRGCVTRTESLAGLGHKEIVHLTISTPGGDYSYPLYLYIPEGASAQNPVPLAIYIGNRPHKDSLTRRPPYLSDEEFAEAMAPAMDRYDGPVDSATGLPDLAAISPKGCDLDNALDLDNWPVRMLLERGYATVSYYTEDVEPDYYTDGNQGLLHMFAGCGYTWKTIGAWSFAASRLLDYLEKDPRFTKDVSITGHSRGGKTALWCTANDPRITCCYTNNSGCTGTALSRGKRGEGVKQINTLFPYWFCDKYKEYNDSVESLPVDQHMLLALTAPRLLYVASADSDRWADPESEYASVLEASKVYCALQEPGLLDADDTIALPPAGTVLHRGTIGYHIRKGAHALSREDWKLFCDFWDQHRRRG